MNMSLLRNFKVKQKDLKILTETIKKILLINQAKKNKKKKSIKTNKNLKKIKIKI